jgi:hypothetical protein
MMPRSHVRGTEWAVRLYQLRPRVIRLDAAYWSLRLIAWIHASLHAVAVIPWNLKRHKNRSYLPSTWTKEELGKRSSIERFFGRVFLFFHLQRPPLWGWSAIARQVALPLHRFHHCWPGCSPRRPSRVDPLSPLASSLTPGRLYELGSAMSVPDREADENVMYRRNALILYSVPILLCS